MSASAPVRVRFAPSPTGFWHPGNARTALFVWLFARHEGGTFVLRIEDTDQVRNTPEAVHNLLESMAWLGMDYDEGPEVGGPYGPYFQSQRLSLYTAAAGRLLAEGNAYYCFATPEELEAMRGEQRARGIPAPKYNGLYRDYPREQALARIADGERHVIRFRTPPGRPIVMDDIVRGRVEFNSDDLDDFVIVKGDGFPVYNFACVVDDSSMMISHVVRAEEHLSNTPRQILIYEALGYPIPQFCHLPLIVNTAKKKLSKRDPGVRSILDYRDEGILAGAVANHLGLLGWSPGDGEEILSIDGMIQRFTLDRVSPSPAVFDAKKLEYLGAEHLKRADTDVLVEPSLPFFLASGLVSDPPTEYQLVELRKAIDLLKTRAWNLRNLAESAAYLFTDDFEMDPDGARKRLLKSPATANALLVAADGLEGAASWNAAVIEEAFRAALEGGDHHVGDAIHATRMAVSGSPRGPGIFEVLEAVSQGRAVGRMRRTAEWLREGRFGPDGRIAPA